MADNNNNNNIIFSHKDIAIFKLLVDSNLYSDRIRTRILALLTFYQLQNVPATYAMLKSEYDIDFSETSIYNVLKIYKTNGIEGVIGGKVPLKLDKTYDCIKKSFQEAIAKARASNEKSSQNKKSSFQSSSSHRANKIKAIFCNEEALAIIIESCPSYIEEIGNNKVNVVDAKNPSTLLLTTERVTLKEAIDKEVSETQSISSPMNVREFILREFALCNKKDSEYSLLASGHFIPANIPEHIGEYKCNSIKDVIKLLSGILLIDEGIEHVAEIKELTSKLQALYSSPKEKFQLIWDIDDIGSISSDWRQEDHSTTEVITRIHKPNGFIIEASAQNKTSNCKLFEEEFDYCADSVLEDVTYFEENIFLHYRSYVELLKKVLGNKYDFEHKEEHKSERVLIELETSVGRISFYGNKVLRNNLKAKEYLYTKGFEKLAMNLCNKEHFSEAANEINERQYREENEKVIGNTLRNYVENIGNENYKKVRIEAMEILSEKGYHFSGNYGFSNYELLDYSVKYPDIKAQISEETLNETSNNLEQTIAEYNSLYPNVILSEKEKNDLILECCHHSTSYCHVDEVCVKYQKHTHGENAVPREKRFVNNAVGVNVVDEERHLFVAPDITSLMENMLAYNLQNDNFANRRIVFLVDGATNIFKNIDNLFKFRAIPGANNKLEIEVILDWYHLHKKVYELLSMAWVSGPKNKEIREKIHKNLFWYLWNNQPLKACEYLRNLPSEYIKNQYKLKEVIDYITRKQKYMTHYGLRKKLNLPISSNPVERANRKLCSERQKKNGSSWSDYGSFGMCQVALIKNDDNKVA